MPGNDKYNDDDYVAKLLAEDAKKSSQRYAAVGLSALLPKRPTNGAPKPNTRFLSHLVREVDNHNVALKKKEELEARIRLRQLSRQENRDREDRRNINDDGRDRKRRRIDNHDDGRLRYQDRDESPADSRARRRSTSPRNDTDYQDEKRRRRTHRTERDNHLERRGDVLSTTAHRNRDRDRPEKKSHERHKRVRSPTPERSSRHHHSHRTDGSHRHRRRRSETPLSENTNDDNSESDPLSELIGPKPIPRGRGHKKPSTKSSSNIDAHFSSTYNPSLDVQPESDGDGHGGEQEDWDMALEALRDRTMWRKKQSERLREAGFGEDEIQKWEAKATARPSGGGESKNADGDVKDVRWKKKGEAREWDVGKEGIK